MSAFCRFSSCLIFAIIPLFVAINFPLALVAQEAGSASGVGVAPRPLITQPVDEAQVTVLKGNTHRLARPEFDLGTRRTLLRLGSLRWRCDLCSQRFEWNDGDGQC